MQASVSVIIPTKNVEEYLPGCIRSVRACLYPQELIQVIVVDNGSTDATVELARDLADKVLVYPGVSIASLRNRGAENAHGEVLAFLDADCLAGREWLAAGVQNVLQENCVAGCQYELPESPSWVEADWFCQRETGRTVTTHTAAGNLFISRELFRRLGGFNEGLVTGEDTEFCARARRQVPIISDDRIGAVHLGNPKNLAQFLRREIWYGLGAFGSFRVNKLDKPLFGTIALAFLTMGQLVGLLAACCLDWGMQLVGLSSIGVGGLLVTTVAYRRRFLKGPLHAVRLAFLYYLYYLGRAISLFYLLLGRSYYHGIKEASKRLGRK